MSWQKRQRHRPPSRLYILRQIRRQSQQKITKYQRVTPVIWLSLERQQRDPPNAAIQMIVFTARLPRALAHSLSLSHAGDWLNAIPSSSLGLHLMDREFRVCLQYWLGVPVFEYDVRCPVCSSPADSRVTIRWAAGEIVTEYCATTPSVTPSSIPLSLQL